MKLYNNIELIPEVDESNKKNLSTVGSVHSQLWTKKTKIVIDEPEHYSLASVQDGTVGLKIVDDGSIADASTEIEISTVNNKKLETDIHTYATGEYVELIAETNHEETYEESTYLPRSEAPEEATLMTITEFNDMWGTTEILPYTEV